MQTSEKFIEIGIDREQHALRIDCIDEIIRMQEINMGEIPEDRMVFMMRLGKKRQPDTAAPLFIPIASSNPGIKPVMDGGTYPAPFLLKLYCATQGASIGYILNPGPNERWSLYTEPIRLPPDKTTVKAKAVRIGYEESEERTAVFNIVNTIEARIGQCRYSC